MRFSFTLLSLLILFLEPVAAGPRTLDGKPVPLSTSSKPRLIELELADPSLAATEVKRQQLKYLINCALPDSMVLYSLQGRERITFPGRLGLAPEWMKHPLTLPQERWISACMLALTNYFGKHVEVSLQANSKLVPSLEQTEDETRIFSIFEGGFFGNLFSANPVAYVCAGTRTKIEAQNQVFHNRICAMATGDSTVDGKPLTACQFILTGSCSDPTSFIVNGETYQEVIFVFLKPAN